MRLAVILQHRRRLLMQFDPTKRSPSPHSTSTHTLRRSLAQQATASARKHTSPSPSESSAEHPVKIPKLEDTHSPLASATRARRGPSSVFSPEFKMPPSSLSSSPSPAPSSSARTPRHHGPSGMRPPRSASASSSSRKGKTRAREPPPLGAEHSPPLHDYAYLCREQRDLTHGQLKESWEDNPKSALSNYCATNTAEGLPVYETVEGHLPQQRRGFWRASVKVKVSEVIVGVGDSPIKKEAEKLAALSAIYLLHAKNLLLSPPKLPKPPDGPTGQDKVLLSDSTEVTYERARQFMDYYCRKYGFGKPDVTFVEQKGKRGQNSTWEATLTVGGRRIGLGAAPNKRAAQIACFLDVTQYLESCDPDLWRTFVHEAKTGRDLGLAPKVFFQMSEGLEDEIRDLCHDIRKSTLYHNRPAIGSRKTGSDLPDAGAAPVTHAPTALRGHRRPVPPTLLATKSDALLKRRNEYLADPKLASMRATRESLPVYSKSEGLMAHIRDNDVSICMAATGSGKTTQIPQMILDDYIARGDGARCNVVCTQPRRIAAISVADRVSKERGETVGRGTVGYQVRFDAKLPEEHGSITFCTTGIFLKRLQTALGESGSTFRSLDDVTHVVVDEVHERDVDTDLLLVALKRLLEERKTRKKPIKIVLMSATIDPTLFQQYFLDDKGQPAGVTEIPGRSFPVTKHFMEDYVPQLVQSSQTGWVFAQESVLKYLHNELGSEVASTLVPTRYAPHPNQSGALHDDLELPIPLVALTISHVLRKTDSGHVLVFLPGWEDITSVQRCLLDHSRPLGVNFNDPTMYSIHLLHSTIPLAEQQIIFEPPPEGVRRIILATNIAETSITIPDVVYVVDTGKIKEQRYDPERHMSALVSAWVGSSNLNQRAGRAGRHRPGEYFGILGTRRADELHPYQTVEMKRVDLSNVVMHVKALDFPGMAVEDVLAATIEPPAAARVEAAMKDLIMVGALDHNKNLTSLGRVLLQLPVEAQMGRLVLFGSFFRCLDQALTLAAILTNRDPFVSPMHLKQEAAAKKSSWTPREFRSDALATLQAYNAWWAMQGNGEYVSANRFCVDNFLSKPTLLMIQKIKQHLLQSLYTAGVIEVSAGGSIVGPSAGARVRDFTVPPELNANGDSLPLLAALIAIATQPKFAIRTGDKTYRTAQDKHTFIHPSSVNHRRKEDPNASYSNEKQLYAFAEKRQNVSGGGSNPQMFLVTTTRLDPMTYVLFGAYNIEVVERGLECDGWLPIVGNIDALDDIQRLKTLMESCMLRVFEGITMGRRHRSQQRLPLPVVPREEESESEDEGDSRKDYSMSQIEVKELDLLTRDIVRILNRYSDERLETQSRQNSRPATPMGSPAFASLRLPGGPSGSMSGYSTPYNVGSAYNSRPGTPSRLSRRF